MEPFMKVDKTSNFKETDHQIDETSLKKWYSSEKLVLYVKLQATFDDMFAKEN